ncbi:uncharacterized protein L969DRAFT_96763 [Mixia osmundae IAM 14324]|uniref:Uncharacterized protein n=1 Tax=Mixia osmundae (strain CBS 9802 / IAM 14324 / JCM 22182 / KY 12970) TaxID=764103 RepID=G7DZN1_MIXOS|nr:uncharacterized protein L969DRAFT_96763 [Mixia osmundae IAM 14324]KEI37203.1 hypothetical protein L969DRAFT_96763 [Mixia osmundae IAM 14324]GAA96041.1 hypothetical protein E5Q_02702 [Mixia osmundae IAM 14324]
MISLFLLTCSASTEGYNTIWPCLSAGLVCLLTVAVRSLLAGTGFLARVPQSDRLFFAAALIASGIALSTEQILEPLRDHRQQIRMRAISQILRSLPALEHLSVVDQLNWEHEDILPFDALDGLELEHHPKSLTYSNDFSSSYAALASLLSHLDGIRCLRLRKMGQIVTAANASERRAFWIWPERRPPLRLRRLTELYLDQADLSWQDICALVPPTLSALSVRRPNLPGFESIFNHCCGSLRVLLVHHAETIAPTINFSKLQRLQAASFSHVLIGPIIGSAPDEVSTAQDLQNERIEWLQLASQAALLSALDKAQGLRHLRIDVPVSYSTGYNLAVFAKRMPRLRRMTLLSAGSSASEHVETLIEACHAIDVPVDIRETVVYNAQ